MLVLPIVNNRRVMNVRLQLKDVKKVKRGVKFDDALSSEIIVNRERFSKSSFYEIRDPKSTVDFIRSKSILYPRSYFVTTKENNNNPFYDVYEVPVPPEKVNDSLDTLYGSAISDLRNEVPNMPDRGRYISFSDLGIGENITEEKMAKLYKIVNEVRDSSLWPKLFKEAGVEDLEATIDFMKNFECTILPDTTIAEDSLQDTLTALSNLRTRDFKNLNKYYGTAKSNRDIYTKISYINQIIYNKPLSLIKNDEPKRLVKTKEEYPKVA